MRIRIDRGRCQGAGQCALNAPELFDQSDDDGLVVVLDDRPPPALRHKARLAEQLCPNSVIRVLEAEDDG
ncbi:ferredoxin [Streptantibioticus rubrisoli]|uniref:Ferredoxin n=1 Tax=Streptantibioticus rubrisoli TaxID=1387313 RepID=A0ABT1PB50_9ACTN|nr:ferredoxin [Streptantibioticus rubrisoli]MCQ4041535.1 ferredoxin [Streptantibioticus rubrisoli]